MSVTLKATVASGRKPWAWSVWAPSICFLETISVYLLLASPKRAPTMLSLFTAAPPVPCVVPGTQQILCKRLLNEEQLHEWINELGALLLKVEVHWCSESMINLLWTWDHLTSASSRKQASLIPSFLVAQSLVQWSSWFRVSKACHSHCKDSP